MDAVDGVGWANERVTVAVDGAPRLLERTIARVTGLAVDAIAITHRCPRCGSESHGAPFANAPVFASRAYAAGFTAAAVSRVAPVGIDLEFIERVSRLPVDSVLLHPSEAAALADLSEPLRSRKLAELWTAKEAILKLAGVGLAVDPAQLFLEVVGDGLELVEWPPVLGFTFAPELHTFDIGFDLVGAVAFGSDVTR